MAVKLSTSPAVDFSVFQMDMGAFDRPPVFRVRVFGLGVHGGYPQHHGL